MRALLMLYPDNFEGEIDSADEIIAMLKQQALSQLLDYLARFEHSEWQSRQFLLRRKYHASIIEESISYCLKKKYISDVRFAELLVRSLIERGSSKQAIISKLYEQHIKPAFWEPILDELYDRDDAAEKLEETLEKYCASHSSLPQNQLREKAFTYLYRKGFDLEMISAAWERYAGR
ncbi:MAG: RecX family transcriptional regulator [Candidatus Cloacimonadaceae bacterium]|nr:RecX family transcriptional regulator [Candidatus Cloacimonadaceae bacterium]